MKGLKSKINRQRSAILLFFAFLVLSLSLFSIAPSVSAQSAEENPSSPLFRLSACDGPRLPQSVGTPQFYEEFRQKNGHAYIPCDFRGLMLQAQRLLNVAIVIGVLAAVVMFSFAGFLYITGGNNPSKRGRANGIFKKVGVGFIIMLSAWFIVYQILAWLTDNQGFRTLLGTP